MDNSTISKIKLIMALECTRDLADLIGSNFKPILVNKATRIIILELISKSVINNNQSDEVSDAGLVPWITYDSFILCDTIIIIFIILQDDYREEEEEEQEQKRDS